MSDAITRLNAALEGRYSVERELGEGGMATVYLAKDLKHNRNVALKVLNPEFAAVIGAERFLAEIETTANLQHPHILPLHDSGVADGLLFYVMPYVEGESLREKLDREQQLSVDEAVGLTTAVAEALQAAHEQGVIHRDIKPANILLSRGSPLVADFGVALAVSAAGGDRLTETGLSMGTPHYMSPEQAAGESRIDARSDIYSLAAMLYEMLAGEPPYTGPTTQVILTKRLVEPVPSVRRIRDKVPASIDAAIQQALAPVPADRFATTGEFTAALTTTVVSELKKSVRWKPWAAAGVAAALVTAALVTELGRSGGVETAELIDPNSIVVLPFVNMSSDPEQEYMSDGIAEELLSLLARIPELKVISRTTAFSFKGRNDLTVGEIAAQLGVSHVLEGSVRKAGNTIRITAQLIEAQSDAHLWSETYDRTLDDIFAVQDEIAAKVVSELRVTLLGELPQVRETDPEAYSLFLQARHISNTAITQGDFETVVSTLERVFEIDPDYAPAYVLLAALYTDQTLRGWRPPEEGFQMALDAAERALSPDPDFPPARAMLGSVMVAQGDVAEGAGHVQRALELDATNSEVLFMAGLVLETLGRFDEAIPVFAYVADRDPVFLFNLTNLTASYLYTGRWEDAAATSRTILALNPLDATAPFMLSFALVGMGELEEALAVAESVAIPPVRLMGVAIASHELGRPPEFESAFQELREEWGEAAPELVASVYAYTGDVDAAFEWLDRVTFEVADPSELIFSPFLANLHDDPRWTAFRERIGMSEERLAAISFEVRVPR
jgi:serine/threonine protein kinase/tetratricopeptide (TPR) repeat protein